MPICVADRWRCSSQLLSQFSGQYIGKCCSESRGNNIYNEVVSNGGHQWYFNCAVANKNINMTLMSKAYSQQDKIIRELQQHNGLLLWSLFVGHWPAGPHPQTKSNALKGVGSGFLPWELVTFSEFFACNLHASCIQLTELQRWNSENMISCMRLMLSGFHYWSPVSFMQVACNAMQNLRVSLNYTFSYTSNIFF